MQCEIWGAKVARDNLRCVEPFGTIATSYELSCSKNMSINEDSQTQMKNRLRVAAKAAIGESECSLNACCK